MPSVPYLQLIRSAVSQGLSANAAYRDMQAQAQALAAETGERWTGIRRQAFLQIYSETVALRARVPEAMQQPKNRPPLASEILPRTTTRASGYGNWAAIYSRQVGSADVEVEYYFQRTAEPLTPEELEQMAQQDFEASSQSDHGSKRGYVFLGAMYTGTERMVPMAA